MANPLFVAIIADMIASNVEGDTTMMKKPAKKKGKRY
jgi:hypothetical protein